MKILLATDGSKHAEDAAKLLRRLSCEREIDLTVLIVTYLPKLGPNEDGDDWVQRFITNEQAHADSAFAAVRDLFNGTNATLHQVIQHGHVGHAACELALQIDADLIVVGAKGHSTLDRMLLGSTSDFVATQAHCSVLVARPTEIDGNCDGRLGVTIGFDGSERAEDAVKHYCEFQWGSNSDVNIVNVVQPLRTFTQELVPSATGQSETHLTEARERLKEIGAKLQDSVATAQETVVESRYIGSALCEAAATNSSDLIVVGDTGRSELGKLLLGSVTNYVIRHSECSVLICRRASKQ